ncbi:cysteine-rich RLK (RECEPTOR-like protein kinase) 8 [Abeliophyllum distichum]|uniref:Cysteine-rich RLK (RECEPTOR-like protein kinase) 8 n=1 Tax=Abeliophyllum distichum TaxID=126358 RepID=A0ABD1V8C5_9LAMI
MFALVNSCMKNSVSPHSLALLKTLMVMGWLMWPTLLMAKDDTDLQHNVTISRKLGPLQNLTATNSVIIARRKVTSLKIVVSCVPATSLLPLSSSEPQHDPVLHEPYHSTRVSRPLYWYGFSSSILKATLDTTFAPKFYSQASTQKCWCQDIQDELQALQDNHTWDILLCLARVKLNGCKWVYTIKLHDDGSIERHKVCLVALRNRHEYGLDYEETFAPVAKMPTICNVTAIVVLKGWSLRQMDVKNAFLRGNLKEKIFISPHPGLFSPSSVEVCT